MAFVRDIGLKWDGQLTLLASLSGCGLTSRSDQETRTSGFLL